jgi:putative membrane protein
LVGVTLVLPYTRGMNTPAEGPISPKWGLRCLLGGALMGLANLVPGISGGTMLLAAGIYPRFIQALAELSGLRFRKSSFIVLGLVGVAGAGAILLGAGTVKDAVVEHRWAMYSVFIGLTLGGVPVLWQMARPATNPFWAGIVVGLLVMVALAWLQISGASSGTSREGVPMMFIAGVAGASAMILPGVSGGYLLLVLGVYVPVLSAIDALKEALRAGNLESASDPVLGVVLPVGVGVAIGILVISNLIKIVLERFEQPTLGALMGLLVGAVFGLWPFQEGVAPKVGEMFKGQVLTAERLADLSPDKYPTEFYAPTFTDVMMAVGLIGVGYMITTLVAHVGGAKPARR